MTSQSLQLILQLVGGVILISHLGTSILLSSRKVLCRVCEFLDLSKTVRWYGVKICEATFLSLNLVHHALTCRSKGSHVGIADKDLGDFYVG